MRQLLVVAVSTVVVATLLTVLAPDGEHGETSGTSVAAPLGSQPLGPTMFNVASLNLLGAGHTDGADPDRPGFANSSKRLGWSMQALNEQKVQVVGFQEMHLPQARQFESSYGDNWNAFPGTSLSERSAHNSIAWRRSSWELLRAKTVMIPYFDGNPFPMPYVMLGNRTTGQRIWILNVHNPADAHGEAQRYRDAAVRREIDLVNQLTSNFPNLPVFMTGDMNDRERFFCPIVARTNLVSASGGSATRKQCTPPPVMNVDWLLGTGQDNTFTNYLVRRDQLVQKATDHPLITARANIPRPDMRKRALRHVVVVSVDGLRSRTIRSLGAEQTPTLHRLMREGAATLNARTTAESTRALPNTTSMLTSVRVRARRGGHGVTYDSDLGRTVHASAGRYVQSVFDRVHDDARGTRLFSTAARMDTLSRSWDSTNGAVDRHGVDDGRGKISVSVRMQRSGQLVDALVARLGKAPGAFTFAALDAPLRAGVAYGFGSPEYRASVGRIDRLVRRVLDSIESDPTLNDNTVLIVTSSSGGTRRDQADETSAAEYTVPLIISGPGVPAGADLYDLNPDWRDPGTARAGHSDPPAIRTGVVANLSLKLLRLPPLSRSSFDPDQRFNVFDD